MVHPPSAAGLIAASIQYGHAHIRMLQGYAGTFESGFPDEFSFEDWLFRIEGLAEDEQKLAHGEHVSGPAADAYHFRVTAASREFAGRVLTSERQARDLVGNPLLQIHHGQGMTCVLNPATAACRLRGTADGPMVTPDLNDCRPKCPNLVRTDRDIEHVREQAAGLAEIVANPPRPTTATRAWPTRARPVEADHRCAPARSRRPMTKIPLNGETDPTRRAIITAMNRLLAGTPQRSNGRLNITRPAIEADLKRRHLTHQHPDLKNLSQEQVAKSEAQRRSHVRSADTFEELKRKHIDLQAHCRFLEARLQNYATALDLMALENTALSGRDAEAAKVRVMPRRPHMP
ncbi:hypothetical protein [Streptomyces sp. SID3343]|uniref:hypothetical protein n=1 Tax=Streptomyces sp. SID3343 TaxID=2690260 RepID=UPI00136C3B34|nr:hypothetical protein [Streptomyces sp. SID3343]MYW01121.1 hypothetical protein [Streptomyces sp. SID3343]